MIVDDAVFEVDNRWVVTARITYGLRWCSFSNLRPPTMSNDLRHEPHLGMSEPTAELKKVRRFQTGVRSLIVLVATCGTLMWAARALWENQHPAFDIARRLNAKRPTPNASTPSAD